MKIKFKAKNIFTGQTRDVEISQKAIENIWNSGVGRCCGPCKCKVEPDGTCPKGWPSQGEAVYGV